MEHQHEFRQGMLAAYVDHKKAFDSVHREALWDLMCVCRIPLVIIGPLTGLYSKTESDVNCREGGEGARVQLLSCECMSEAGMRLSSVTVQHMYGLCTGQSCGSKSLFTICRQYQDH